MLLFTLEQSADNYSNRLIGLVTATRARRDPSVLVRSDQQSNST